MKLTQLENEDAIDLIANIIEPLGQIAQDKKIQELLKETNKLVLVQYILKNHKKSIIEILAAMDGTPVEEYHCNVITITKDLLEIVNNKELSEVFSL